eukprot:g28204.t1
MQKETNQDNNTGLGTEYGLTIQGLAQNMTEYPHVALWRLHHKFGIAPENQENIWDCAHLVDFPGLVV